MKDQLSAWRCRVDFLELACLALGFKSGTHGSQILNLAARYRCNSPLVGRVFYTEGKSLIFYAFDLGNRTPAKRNASFQVWGARGPAQRQAKSLGIFYVDDQKQNRWVLKSDDPVVLAEIDSVFVTIEPPGGSAKPSGHRLLFAYLKANPNHP